MLLPPHPNAVKLFTLVSRIPSNVLIEVVRAYCRLQCWRQASFFITWVSRLTGQSRLKQTDAEVCIKSIQKYMNIRWLKSLVFILWLSAWMCDFCFLMNPLSDHVRCHCSISHSTFCWIMVYQIYCFNGRGIGDFLGYIFT